MRIVVTGATGTIGRSLVEMLRGAGDTPVALARDAERARDVLGAGIEVHAWAEPKSQPAPAAALRGADAVIHLLGEPVAQRWTSAAKQEIRDSRVLGTRQLVAGLADVPAAERPAVLVSQSASGFYGPHGDEALTEQDGPGADFLAEVVAAWEREATAAETHGLRVVLTRTGVVLSPQDGALAKMLPPFKAGVGGPVAGGRQYVPWIHLDDVVGALHRCASDDGARGPVNLTAPHPVTNTELSKALGRVLHRPAIFPVPALAIRALYGEMAAIVTTGARIIPRRLQEMGYEFVQPEIEPALRDVLDRA